MQHVMARGWTRDRARSEYPDAVVIEVRSTMDADAAERAARGGAPVVAIGEILTPEDRVAWYLTHSRLSGFGDVSLAPSLADSEQETAATLPEETRALIAELAQGNTLGQAAERLHVSRRTADRRLAEARRQFTVATTPQLIAAVQRRGRGAGPATPGRVVGRAAELTTLTESLVEERSALVLGEGGVGKSALLAAVIESLDRRTVRVTGTAAGQWRTLGALLEAFDGLPANADAESAADAVEAAVGPDLLVVDDVHLLDPLSLDVVRTLSSRVSVLAAGRPGSGTEAVAVAELVDAFGTVVPLAPLTDHAAIALARRIAPSLPDADLTRVVTGSGGIPLLIEFLAATGPEDGPARIVSAVRPLSPAAQRALVRLALGGRLASDDAVGAGLVASGLAVTDPGGGISIRHAVVAATALSEVPSSLVRAVHGELAREASDDATAAFHFAAAGELDDARDRALAAADACDVPADRAHLLKLAGESSSETAQRVALLLRSCLDYAQAGRWSQILATAETIDRELLSQSEAARLAIVTSRAQWHLGEAEAAIATARSGLATVSGTGTPAEATLLGEIVQRECLLLGPQDGHEEMLERGFRLVGEGPGHASLLNAAGTLAYMRTAGGDIEWSAGRRAALAEGDLDAFLRTSNNVITWHESNGDQQYALDLAAEMAERAGVLALGEWQAQFRAMAANLLFYRGRFPEALEILDEVEASAIDALTRHQARITKGACLIELGLLDAAERTLPPSGPSGARDDVDDAFLHAWLLLAAGRPQWAKQVADAATEAIGADGEHSHVGTWSHLLCIRAWAELDLGLDVTIPDEQPTTGLDRLLDRELRALAVLRTDPRRAATELAELAGQFEHRAVGYGIRVRYAHAEALRLAGDADAIPALLTVETAADALSMAPLLARIRRSLRHAGVHRSAARGRDRSGLLTRREREVLDLVATGHTYAEIGRRLGVSRPTVRRLVDNARAKLGTPGRLSTVAAM